MFDITRETFTLISCVLTADQNCLNYNENKTFIIIRLIKMDGEGSWHLNDSKNVFIPCLFWIWK